MTLVIKIYTSIISKKGGLPITYRKHIFCVDTHTAGEPTRVIISGFAWKKCDCMAEKLEYFHDHYGNIHEALLLEPRGHIDLVGSIVSESCDPRADFGVFFIESAGYLTMCGHGTIGTVTALIELGIVECHDQEKPTVRIDTPAGLVTTYATMDAAKNKVKSISFDNVPSFVYQSNCSTHFVDLGQIDFDICFGGNFFAAVQVEQLGLEITRENSPHLCEIGMRILNMVRKEFPVQHPLLTHLNSVELVIFYQYQPELKKLHSIVIFGKGQIDRSPCGTGTSAMTALLYSKGDIALEEEFVAESVLGTQFQAMAVSALQEAGRNAVIPRITGTAYITGINQLIIDAQDPFKNGFTL